MKSVDELVVFARQKGCSDVHLTVGSGCCFRINGALVPVDIDCTDAQCESAIRALCDKRMTAQLDAGKDADFSFRTSDGNRQRANIYRQDGRLACAIRLLSDRIPTIEQLGLPQVLKSLAEMPRGLVLVTGPTGSGKSTTLAAMIDHVNALKPVHILTIEDPVEYVYEQRRAMIHQREVGRDVESFASALRSALREDPDVILVGEMRDYETISAAVTAAETGHLVLSTLHTTGAAQTIDRIVDACPPQSQQQMRVQLSTILRGVITQALLPLADGSGRCAATEIMLGSDAVLNLIRENKSYQLISVMQSSGSLGMHTLDNDLEQLARGGRIKRETAMSAAVYPGEMRL